MKILFLFCFILICGDMLSKSPYQNSPASFLLPDVMAEHSRMFAPGLVSTGLDETGGVFSPKYDEFYYTVRYREYSAIVYIRYEGGVWRHPQVVSFSGEYRDEDPFISSDGKRLYFSSTRPVNGEEDEGVWNLWYVKRNGSQWGEPTCIVIDTTRHERHPTVSDGGALFYYADYGSNRVSFDFDHSSIYMVELQHQGELSSSAARVVISSDGSDYSPVISSNGRLLFFASNREGGKGGSDIYFSHKNEEGEWEKEQNAGRLVNSSYSTHYPVFTPDNEILFFSGNRRIRVPLNDRLTYSFLRNSALGYGNGANNIYYIDLDLVTSKTE
ncbi:hypothetical protein QA597_04630 [Marinilabiliaceae bacterium ANBcel2]|nr:hypothetical protein [Marinilabiliaceae bacterium ANBcel2]